MCNYGIKRLPGCLTCFQCFNSTGEPKDIYFPQVASFCVLHRASLSSEMGFVSVAGMGPPLGKRIGKCFPSAAGNGRNLARIMTLAFCRVKEATPDSTGYRFPVVGQQFWFHRLLNNGGSRATKRLPAWYHDTKNLNHSMCKL